MTPCKAFSVIAVAGALLMTVMLPSSATAHHLANDVPDNSNPNTVIRNGDECSAGSVIPPISNALRTINGWTYWLRYSQNCRSIWGRSSNQAPRRSDLATNRLGDGNWSGFCTGNTHYSGDTWYWTGQVDDAGHQARTRIDNVGHNCSGDYTWRSNTY